ADGPGSFFALSQQGPAELGALLQEAAVAVRDLAAGREPAAGQTHRLLVRGDERWWTVRVDQVREPGADHVVVTLSDVTRHARAQEALRQTAQSASRLAL